MSYQARCQCGQTRAEIGAEPVIQLCCHCLDCQDATGAAFASIAFFKKADVKVSGGLVEKNYQTESGKATAREYCQHCKTVMFDKSDGFPQLIGVLTDQIAGPFQTQLQCHVWIKDKMANITLPSDIPCYEKGIPKN